MSWLISGDESLGSSFVTWGVGGGAFMGTPGGGTTIGVGAASAGGASAVGLRVHGCLRVVHRPSVLPK